MKSETNPWMLISILLSVLLVASFATNIFVLTKGTSTGTPSGGTVAAPSQGGQYAPTPSAPVAVSVDDDAVLGDANAPVTIIEFSDFQCPFCQRFDTETWPQLKANYIDTGKVKFVYRDYPLPFHQNAEIAAEASECAHEQGKFWEMHDVLFTKGSGDGSGLDSASLKQYAADLKLDTAKFNSCLDSGKYKAEIAADTADGSAAGVSGTPSFFINGQLVVGAQPYSVFQQAIDAALAN